VFYPRVPHAFQVLPAYPSSANYSIRIRVPESLSLITDRIWPTVVHNLEGSVHLVRVLEQLYRLWHAEGYIGPVVVAKVSEMLALWPADHPYESAARLILGLSDEEDQRINHAIGFIESSLHNPPTVDELASELSLSRRHLQRLCGTAFGMSPRAYVNRRRLSYAKDLIIEGLTLTATAAKLGFSTIHSFSRWFKNQTGVTPSDYRRNWLCRP
jgi:AraC-like DNA-binding protein